MISARLVVRVSFATGYSGYTRMLPQKNVIWSQSNLSDHIRDVKSRTLRLIGRRVPECAD